MSKVTMHIIAVIVCVVVHTKAFQSASLQIQPSRPNINNYLMSGIVTYGVLGNIGMIGCANRVINATPKYFSENELQAKVSLKIAI